MAPMFCPSCGKQLLLAGQKFCAHCGGDLSILAGEAQPVRSSPPGAAPPPARATPLLDAAGITPAPTAPPAFVPGNLAPWLEGPPSSSGGPARGSAARSEGPIVVNEEDKHSTEVLVAAVCAGIAIAATVLPWVQTNFLGISASAIQGEPILIAPPAAALIAYWRLQSDPPLSRTSVAVYGQRLAFGIGLLLCLIIVGEMNNASSTLGLFGTSYGISLGIGFYAYAGASVVGLIASFLTSIYGG
jgi:hypothetical protein